MSLLVLQKLVVHLLVDVSLAESFEVSKVIGVLEVFFFDVSKSAVILVGAIKVFIDFH